MNALLELDGISKSYENPELYIAPRGQAPPLHQVIRDATLRVSSNETVAIVGPSGSGKTTLLNIMGTLDRPSTGTVRLAGQDTSQLNENDLSKIRNREIGFIFQLHHLLPQCTVMENVLLPTLPYGIRSVQRDAADRANSLLDRVGLKDHQNYTPAQLSVGQRQRAAVVRALINRPKLLLADEPTGSLDASTAEALGDLLLELNEEEHTALVIVTHSLELARRMHTTLILRDGELTAHG
jgi:ABC-type lipoprotein export system ATPase subunit